MDDHDEARSARASRPVRRSPPPPACDCERYADQESCGGVCVRTAKYDECLSACTSVRMHARPLNRIVKRREKSGRAVTGENPFHRQQEAKRPSVRPCNVQTEPSMYETRTLRANSAKFRAKEGKVEAQVQEPP